MLEELFKAPLHKLTTALVRDYRHVVIEDLNVKGMLRNRRLARAVADVGFGELRRQLTYKADVEQTTVIVTTPRAKAGGFRSNACPYLRLRWRSQGSVRASG